ncbi:hydrolase [Sphingomonas sanguinis]|jgi:glutamate carboxypeptidase|uniref:Hydrolase n=2 Tax=Sphingomonas sanguinis TaxID=33051 RepID=A0A7Y7UPV6_9SPHN|nr:hydrolase [Sphingomonas sanguinis]MBZ6381375.1 hydrolase [Sphingomonas sanguinis]NNG51016.1 hydrolase [Sphingomonas sanguinis]NNG53038.1 hydrolase [Sphingomonas sanguinis]NVP30677.1 hydrolase [Sphingomonas sanguinis]
MERLNPIERDAVASAAAYPMLPLVEEWSAINSGTRNMAGLAIMVDRLAAAFCALPGTLSLIDPEPVERVGADGTPSPLEHGRHLRLSVRPQAPVQMLFTGHMDTVYPVDHPFQAVTRIDDNRLGGPGVADMKGGLAVLLAALSAVEASPLAERFGYDVLINSDEETGSASSAALIARCASGKVAALTYEPALPDGTLAGARGGTGNFTIVVRGRSAHAGRNPEEGRNAIVAAARITVELSQLAAADITVNPARIDGGGPNNVVPDLAMLHVNFRPRALAAIERTGPAMQAIAERIAADHDVSVKVHGSFNRPPKPIDDGAARLFETVRAAGGDLGLTIGWRDTGGVCDGNNIAAAGVPVVDTMGVRGGAIHSPDEYMLIDSLAERAGLSALTILRIIGAA